MNVGFIGDMFFYTFMAKMNMTNFTIHRGHGILTQGAAHDILTATLGVHDHQKFNLKMKEVQIKEKKIITNAKSTSKLIIKCLILTNNHYTFAIQHDVSHLIMLYLIISCDFNVRNRY